MENGENAESMYEYNYIGQARDAIADPNANSAGVSEDERGGIKPSSDNVLFTGVLSEAHMKLAMIAGVECLFRIASVRYGEDGRSRLVVHTKANGAWSAPMPVDFPLGFGEGDVERGGTFDYDFDVVEYTDGRGNQDAYVLLVSGERPEGDATRFDTASTAGMLSVVRLRISNDGVRVISHTSWICRATASRSVRFSAFRKHHRASSWARPRISTAKWWCPLHTKPRRAAVAHRTP